MSYARTNVMRVVRAANVSIFRDTVNNMVQETPFVQGQCIVLEIARGAAVALGLSRDVVTTVQLHNNWISAQFTHEVLTPMPPPPKGVKKEPPVLTRTKYMVVKASAMIRAYREYLETHEVEDNLEGEVMVAEHQRPDVTASPPSEDSSNSSSSPPPSSSSGGKNKNKKKNKKKGKGKK